MTATTPIAYRPLTKSEKDAWLRGANFGAVIAGYTLRAQGVEGVDGGLLYLRILHTA